MSGQSHKRQVCSRNKTVHKMTVPCLRKDSQQDTNRERDEQKHSDREIDREERLEDIGSKTLARRESLEERVLEREAQRHTERLQEKEMMFEEQSEQASTE